MLFEMDFSQLDLPQEDALALLQNSYRKLRQLRRNGIFEQLRISDDGCPNGNDFQSSILFDHSYAGMLLYAVEEAQFILQSRHFDTEWNPGKTALVGSHVPEWENPIATAVRRTKQAFNITVPPTQIWPMRFGIEPRTRVPVQRNILLGLLDRIPSDLRPLEPNGFKLVDWNWRSNVPSMSLLTGEDLDYCLQYYYPRRFN